MMTQMKVPEVGESIQDVEIAQWLKQEGQWVEKDEEIVEVDSEKASVSIPSPTAGRLVRILKRNGDKANVGEVIAEIDDAAQPEQSKAGEAQPVGQQTPADSRQEHEAVSPPSKPAEPAATPDAPAATEPVMPARSQVTGTQRQRQEAEQSSSVPKSADHLESSQAQNEREAGAQKEERKKTPAPTPVSAREEEIVPMSMIRRRIAARLVESQQNGALLTTFNEIDMSAVIELRSELRQLFQEQYGVKPGFMSFFVKAAIEALKRFPEVNAEVRGNDIVFHNYYDIGIAIGGGKGLVVPVLRDADQLSFAEVELAIEDFAKRAVNRKLKPEELTGGTFTISNGGVYGSLLSTPIINPPQSGVLGMHTIQERPVARDGAVVIRPMMYVALTYDHRIVDGREAVGFLRRIKDLVEQPSRILLEV